MIIYCCQTDSGAGIDVFFGGCPALFGGDKGGVIGGGGFRIDAGRCGIAVT
ncbi:hypothetical protein CCHOA_01430 [Corynebacterium choanae]|uniref:Uncharacterized protein n=1 Tax=Corynebacterium choanae TaxID=1862358 RepID=A0A3G6J9K9_9CORY|nr:hypothetical protein CCHOA_01430 [Corynebacterium choanae]